MVVLGVVLERFGARVSARAHAGMREMSLVERREHRPSRNPLVVTRSEEGLLRRLLPPSNDHWWNEPVAQPQIKNSSLLNITPICRNAHKSAPENFQRFVINALSCVRRSEFSMRSWYL